MFFSSLTRTCLLYTSDAADEGLGVDLGGRRIIKKIMNVQWSDKKKISLATFVIENIKFSETSVQILSLISKIESLSEKK